MAEYKGIKAILAKFYKLIKLSAGNGIQISDENVIAISDALSTTISSHTADISLLNSTISKLVFPVGFVYTQYSGTPSPATLDLRISDNCAWVDITSKYQGEFFRAYYNGLSAAFSDSSITKQSAQNLSHSHSIVHGHTATATISHNAKTETAPTNSGIPFGNGSNYWKLTGASISASVSISTYSGSSGSNGGSDLRPINSAIKIWQVQEA